MSSRMLRQEISSCQLCTRLRQHCETVALERRRAYRDQVYWGRPVPPFGPADARLLVVGLAPGAHGANRTGRIFTGDRSGDWLYRALHKAGFANQPQSIGIDDGLELLDARVTCVVKCAPPDNKPLPAEVSTCSSRFLARELGGGSRAEVIIALGRLAWDTVQKLLDPQNSRTPFAHGARRTLPGGGSLLGSFHPSQQNTFTGKLTEPMFDQIFIEARRILDG
jgi:uracil-DNA glycosylase family 4